MAIVNMSRLSLVGLEEDKRSILNFLMERGYVQIDDTASVLDEEYVQYLEKDSSETDLPEIEQKLMHITQSMESVKKYAQIKSGFLAPKEDYKFLTVEKADDAYERALKINVIYKDLESSKSARNALINQRDLLLPWLQLDVPLQSMETQTSKMTLGTLPHLVDLDALRRYLFEEIPECVFGVINEDKQLWYAYIITHKDVYDKAIDAMKDFGFSFVTLPSSKKTAVETVRDYERQMNYYDKEIKALKDDLKAYSGYIPELENLYDYYMIKKDERKAFEKLMKTKSTFYLTGWLPTKEADPFVSELTETFVCYATTEEASVEEGFPILLENNALVTPFESVTNMYSIPSPKDLDPNAIMSFFYIIFFGMMLSDAGYGVIIALACFLIIKKQKLRKGEGNLIKLLGLCGISTTVWGLIFGGVFGDLVPIKAIISPLDDVMILMGMSLLFGIIHIYVGLGIKAVNLIRNGKVIDALFDVGLWYLFITGICLLVIPVIAGPIGIYGTIGKYLAIVGAIGLVLTQGRSFDGIVTKGFKGISSLYGITSYFADILSYSRLMALCLSTGVIGQVINLLGQIAGPVPAIIIGVVGHTANLLINALGAYVHTSRLQYVEFFGKFYEGGGESFTPFRYKTRYTRIDNSRE